MMSKDKKNLLFCFFMGWMLLTIASGSMLINAMDSNEYVEHDCVKFSESFEEKNITIRNVTKEDVTYTLKPFGREGKSQTRLLKPGGLDRYPGDQKMVIIFKRAGREVTYQIGPRKAYSFRLNENDLLELYDGSHGRTDAIDLAPYVPTPMLVVDKMLEMADVDGKDTLYDLGCGDGRIVITAAQKYGAKGVGIDIDPQRIRESKENAKAAGVENLVKFKKEDVLKVNFSKATVVALYLLPESNELLRPLMEKQLKPGVLVVSHNYEIPGWEDKEIENIMIRDKEGEDHYIFLYRR